MSSLIYDHAYYEVGSGRTNLVTDDLRVLLLKNTHAPSQSHKFLSEIVADEISVAGYARQQLANRSLVEDGANHFAYLAADDVTFPSMAAGQSTQYAALFRSSGLLSPDTSPLLALYDFGATPLAGQPLVLHWAALSSGRVFRIGAAGTGGGGGATGGTNDWGDFDMVVWESNVLTPPRLKTTGTLITLDGGVIMTHTQFPVGSTATVHATFSGAAFQHVGLSSDLIAGPWAIFSSKDGSGLYARTNTAGGTSTDTLISASAYFGAQHTYKIEFGASNVKYYVDGTLVVTHTVAIPTNMQVVASDFSQDSNVLLIQSLAVV
jgi:hypothetical protein